MENYKGIYFNNSISQKYYEGGAHFSYIDLYNQLVILYNKINNLNLPLKNKNLDISPIKKKYENKNNIKSYNKKRENSTKENLKKTRNKEKNNFSKSDSIDNNNYNNINLDMFKNSTSRIYYYNKQFKKMHHNSINKNYHLNNKKNFSVINKIKDKQISFDKKKEELNDTKGISHNNNRSSDNRNIYNYCYLNYENKKEKKNFKIDNYNDKKKYLNFSYYNYDLSYNIFLQSKIRNKFRQNKNNSSIFENSKNSASKIKKSENNKCGRSIDKNYHHLENKTDKKKTKGRIKSVDYTSIYYGANSIKKPIYKQNNQILNYQKSKIANESLNNIKPILNKNKKNEELISDVKNIKNSYTKIKQNQMILIKSKK